MSELNEGDKRPFVELKEGEEALVDPTELWMRQANPAFVDGGVPSVKVFETSSRDEGMLSGARSSKTMAREAYEHRRAMGAAVGRELSVGTWGVSVDEVADAGLRAVDDSANLDPDAPPGHAFLDYRHIAELDRPSRRAIRARVLRSAVARGRLWPGGGA